MDAILNRKFSEAIKGYKKEEVDEYVDDVAGEFDKLKREIDELSEKLEVCKDRIREYRNDEDALKDALLGAQKQGNAIISEAKEKAQNIIGDANQKSEEMIKAAEDEVAARKEEAQQIIADALAEKERIEAEAKKAAEDIHTEMTIQTEIDKEILARTKREAEDFRTRLIVEYTSHIELIKSLPETCENEFVKQTTAEHDSSVLRELIASQNGETIPEIKDIPLNDEEPGEDDSDIKVVDSFSDIKVQEGESVEVEESGFTVDNAFETAEEDGAPDFLNDNKPSRNKSKFEKLEFGNNNSHNNNNHSGKKKRK